MRGGPGWAFSLSRTRLFSIFAMLLMAWVVPEQAMATYVDDAYRYQVQLSGMNTIKISVPVYDQSGADCWVSNGNLYAEWTDDNGNKRHRLRLT